MKDTGLIIKFPESPAPKAELPKSPAMKTLSIKDDGKHVELLAEGFSEMDLIAIADWMGSQASARIKKAGLKRKQPKEKKSNDRKKS